jgi:hypothetical protein
MRAEPIKLESLVLDPNNYRLQDEEGFRQTAEDRFHLEQVQRTTLQRLRETGLKELHDSIIANGFLPIERIVVTPYAHGEIGPLYLVIEGNRRVAALKQIREEQGGGVDIPDQVAATLDGVPCLVAEEEGQDPYFRETLMGIRHVGGIKQWGGYQRAKLIADLRDEHGLQPADVAAKLGLSTREVNRRYRAFKGLQQMRENADFGDYAEPALYPLFHEAVEVAEVREWLGWDANSNSFTREEPLSQFYTLIAPSQPDEGSSEIAPKIKSYGDVRQLKNILPNNDARRYLLDPERSFLDALTVGNRDELSRKWRNELTEASASLEGIGALEVRDFSPEDVALLERLIAAASQIIEVHRAVNANQA